MDQNRGANPTGYSCKDVEQQLDEYLDETLTEEQLRSFYGHTASCSACEQLVAEMRFLKEMAASLAEREIPLGVKERLRARLAQESDWEDSGRRAHLRLVK